MLLPSGARSGSSQACQGAGTHVPTAGPRSRDGQPSRALPGLHPECGADRTDPGQACAERPPAGEDAGHTGGPRGRGPFHRPNWTRPCKTMDPPHCLAFNHVFQHLTREPLLLDVPSLFICPQNESPEPSVLILKSG